MAFWFSASTDSYVDYMAYTVGAFAPGDLASPAP